MSQPAHEPAADQAPKGSSAFPKVLILGFISTVIVLETVIFFMFVPSADDVAMLAEAKLVKNVEAKMVEDGEDTVHDENKAIEFDLGPYSNTFTPFGAENNYRVEFHLFGTVKQKDEEHLSSLFAEREKRFKERISLEIRNATKDELNENQLGLIRRRLLATSNELFEEPILLGVGFAEYQVIEE